MIEVPVPVQPATGAGQGTSMVSADAGPLDNVAVILPALNEVESLPRVLADLPAVGIVLVVDNGSRDGTADVARKLGARVVDEPQRGYGAACLRGLATLRRWIDEGSAAVEIVAFIDADYSDYPERLPELVEPIRTDHADFVLGSRLTGVRERGAMPPQSVWGNRLACLLMRLLFGKHFTDLGPFRAIRWTSLQQLAMEDTGFGWTIEMQIKAARQGLRIQEVPVPYRRRIGQSKISGTISGTFRAGGKILWTIARYGLTDRRTTGSSR